MRKFAETIEVFGIIATVIFVFLVAGDTPVTSPEFRIYEIGTFASTALYLVADKVRRLS